MKHLTKYPLLLDNIIKHTNGGSSEQEKLHRCRDRCRAILKYVEGEVKQTENRQRVKRYQKQLDTTALERTKNNPLVAEFKNLYLTTRRLIHEGPLKWKITKDKTVDVHMLLLEDILVLLQKQDKKLILKCQRKTALRSSRTKETVNPVIKLDSVLVRAVATDKRALFIISTSELGPQIYELVALTLLEKNRWKAQIEQAVKGAMKKSCIQKQELVNPTPPPVSVVLQNSDVPPIIAAENFTVSDKEKGPLGTSSPKIDDHNSGELLRQVKHPVLIKETEVGCNRDKEAPLMPTQLTAPLGEQETEKYLVKLPQCNLLSSSQAPEITGALADPAVEEVEMVGNNTNIPLQDSCQSETELKNVGGGANLADDDYIAPVERTCQTDRTESKAGPSTLSTQMISPMKSSEPRPQFGSTEIATSAESPASSLVICDADMFFKTMEQLTLKLNMLKEMTAPHRELLKSFSRAAAEDGPFVNDTGKEPNTQRAHIHSPNGYSNPSFMRDLQSESVAEEGLTEVVEDSSALAISMVGFQRRAHRGWPGLSLSPTTSHSFPALNHLQLHQI